MNLEWMFNISNTKYEEDWYYEESTDSLICLNRKNNTYHTIYCLMEDGYEELFNTIYDLKITDVSVFDTDTCLEELEKDYQEEYISKSVYEYVKKLLKRY